MATQNKSEVDFTEDHKDSSSKKRLMGTWKMVREREA